MSILKYLESSERTPNDIPRYKNSCCMKYTVDKQCGRCPFKQISDEKAQEKAMNECRDKRRGSYQCYDEKRETELRIEYNNQYR